MTICGGSARQLISHINPSGVLCDEKELRNVVMNITTIFRLFLVVTMILGCGCVSTGRGLVAITGQHAYSLTNQLSQTAVNYLLYIPEEYPASRKQWPLILFLHGAGECGDNLDLLKKNGPPMLIAKQNRTFPFVIASPQCPRGNMWANEDQIASLDALLDDLVSRYRIDKDRIYVTGLSRGGFGTWRLATTYPDRFAAIAPICGGEDPEKASLIAHLPIWVFHGAKDKAVPIEKSRQMVAELEKCGGNVKFTVYPDAGHDAWTEAYNNPDLYKWFLQHTRAKNR